MVGNVLEAMEALDGYCIVKPIIDVHLPPKNILNQTMNPFFSA